MHHRLLAKLLMFCRNKHTFKTSFQKCDLLNAKTAPARPHTNVQLSYEVADAFDGCNWNKKIQRHIYINMHV